MRALQILLDPVEKPRRDKARPVHLAAPYGPGKTLSMSPAFGETLARFFFIEHMPQQEENRGQT